MTKKQVAIGAEANEPNDYHPDYRLGVIIGVYLLLMIPISLLAYALGAKNNWDTNSTILFFAITLAIFTVMYVTSALGITVKLLRTFLGFIYRMYVVKKQYQFHVLELKYENPQLTATDNGEYRIVEQPNNDRELLIDYVRYLYETDEAGNFVNIYDNGVIRGAVPWSSRSGKIAKQSAQSWFQKVAYKKGKPIIYYDNNTWIVNIHDYPIVNNIVKSFEGTYVPPVQLIEDKKR